MNDPTETVKTEEILTVDPPEGSQFEKSRLRALSENVQQKEEAAGQNARFRRVSRALSSQMEKTGGSGSCSPEIKTLAITMFLFGTITAAQTVAALMANSLSLLGDCASMFVDTLSYAGNIMGECLEADERRKIRNQLIASGLSLAVLIGITLWVTSEALERILHPSDDEDDVNAYIVFGFALAGLLFDLASFAAFYFNQNEDRNESAELNMNSAFLHVFSDSLRSTTTLAESILIWFFDFNGSKTDAWASLVVSGLILIGAGSAMVTFVKESYDYLYTSRKTPKEGNLQAYQKLDG